jgi:hypothetical protein
MSNIFWKLIKSLNDELRSTSSIKIVELQTPLPLNKKEKGVLENTIPTSIFDFHQELNGLTIKWQIKENIPDVKGCVKILALKEILRDWKGVVYFDFTDDEDRIKYFHPIDFFIDEACVGAFLNEVDQQDSSLYLYDFGDAPVDLNLNMNGYIQMLAASKGFLYWQYAIIEILEDQENPVSQRFKEWMPKLFPGFSWQEYVQKYNQIKIQT